MTELTRVNILRLDVSEVFDLVLGLATPPQVLDGHPASKILVQFPRLS